MIHISSACIIAHVYLDCYITYMLHKNWHQCMHSIGLLNVFMMLLCCIYWMHDVDYWDGVCCCCCAIL